MPTALYTTTHTTNTLYYTTLHWAFLLFQFNVQQWFGLNRYCFLSTIQVSFWAHPKTFRYFLTSLFQERKVFLFSRILSKSKYFSEVDQVCTILSRVIPFRASKARCSVPVISFFLGRLWHRAKKSPWTRAQLHLMMVPVWRWEQMRNLSTLPTYPKIHAIFTNACFHFQQECDWDQYAR